MSKLFNNQS